MIRLYYSDGSTKTIATDSEQVEGSILVLGSFRVPLAKLDGWELLPAQEHESETSDDQI